jgi:hypothetical protein
LQTMGQKIVVWRVQLGVRVVRQTAIFWGHIINRIIEQDFKLTTS